MGSILPAIKGKHTLFCTLSVSLLFPSVCNLEGRRCLGFLLVSPSATCCNAKETYSFTWDNEDLSFTMRSEETNCCGFPNVSSSRIAGCEIAPLRNITWHTRFANEPMPMSMYHDLEVFCYVSARQACCSQKHFTGLKCVWMLFSLAM